MTKPVVAIVGAGLTGLAAAHQLTQAGIYCTIFDKSRGVGGRMATRRAECQGATLRFDHGASHLTHAQATKIAALTAPDSVAQSSHTQSLQRLCEAAELRPWNTSNFEKPANLISPAGISAVGKALSTHLDIKLNATITKASRDASRDNWHLDTQDAPIPRSFDLLIVTTPPVQAANLLGPLQGPILPALSKIQPRACWTLMLGTQRPIAENARSYSGAIIERVVAEHSKGRPHPNELSSYSIQAGRDWSQQHADTDARAVTQSLLRELQILDWDGSEIVHQQIHRWLYAGVANPANAPCLTDPAQRLVCAGDWCLGNNIDSALTSGRAAAKEALNILG